MSDDHTTDLNDGDSPTWTPALTSSPPPPSILRPCIVLAPIDSPMPAPLHEALHEANLAPRIEHDPRLAMAEACLLRREARQRAAAGLDADPCVPPIVLIAAPQGATAEMIDTLHRIVPDIPVLLLVGDQLGELDLHDDPSPELVPDEIMSLLGTDVDESPSREHV
jgi:hypothetical protein